MIDVLKKITELREERNWSAYKLAQESGLSVTTISSWYNKNIIPTIPTLQKVCDGFGISMSQFFLDENDYYIATERELQMLVEYNRLDKEQQERLYSFLQTL